MAQQAQPGGNHQQNGQIQSNQPPPQATNPSPNFPYDDPTNILRVYPFVSYTPTARTALHMASHTVTYPEFASSTDLYPEHAAAFQRLDHPVSAGDWEMRNSMEARVRNVMSMGGPSYSSSYNPAAGSSTLPPDSYTPYPGHQQPPPMPYNFMSSYLPSPAATYREPPTPTSASSVHAPSPAPSSDMEYFNNFINDTLSQARNRLPTPDEGTPTPGSAKGKKAATSQRVSSATPSLSRALARAAFTPDDSPDPLTSDLTGPTPTKRRKRSHDAASPTLLASHAPQSKQNGVSRPADGPSPLPKLNLTQLAAAARKASVAPKAPSSASASSAAPTDEEESEEDDLGWDEGNVKDKDNDGDWAMSSQADHTSPAPFGGQVPPGSARTGERDGRTHFQKLQSCLEDIFEESDALPAEPTIYDLSRSKYFGSISSVAAQPLLTDAAMEKVGRYVIRVQDQNKKSYTGNREGVSLEPEVIARILRLLGRSISDGQGVVLFSNDIKSVGQDASNKKGKGGKGNKSSKSPVKGENEVKDGGDQNAGLTEEDLANKQAAMRIVRSAVLAAECSLCVLDTPGLPKQLLSEDVLSEEVSVVKEQLASTVIPGMEALVGQKITSSFLARLLQSDSKDEGKIKSKRFSIFPDPTLSAIANSCLRAAPRIASLVSRSDIAFSDQLVIQTVYLAISPLFVADAPMKKGKAKDLPHDGQRAMNALRAEALACLRGVFARYENQRQWIIEEILGSMGKTPDAGASKARYQLANGPSISTISALLLQLVQASAFGVSTRVRRMRASLAEMEMVTPAKEDTANVLDEETRVCSDAIDSALRSARSVAVYLVQRSGASKTSKNTHDTDYKAVLDVFIGDLLSVLYRPEWPAASLYLTVFSKLMISALDDNKGGIEASAAKGLALDYLGDIAARLKHLSLEMNDTKHVPCLDEVISHAVVDKLEALVKEHSVISHYLSTSGKDDAMYASSLEMSSILWAQELQSAIRKVTSVQEKLSVEKDQEAQDTRGRLVIIDSQLREALGKIWTGNDDVFELGDPNQASLAAQANIAVARGRSLQTAFEPILVALIQSMGNPIIAIRSKALRGLGSVITVDPEVLAHPAARQAIEERLSDASPSVRDAAVELVGKYVVQKPKLSAEYYPHLALRVSDTGLGVRKRVIKLLRGISSTTTDRDIKVDICCKMVTLAGDTDDNIKDLATKSLADMLYPPDSRIALSASLLVDVVEKYQGSNAAVEGAVKEVLKEWTKLGQTDKYKETVQALIERLIDATEQSDLDVLAQIRAIHLLCTAQVDLIDINKAEVLLSYLKPKPSHNDETSSNILLLKIFRISIPTLPRAASQFASDLSKLLMPMISSPFGGFLGLKETVGCFCAVTKYLTRDYKTIIRVLMACERKIRHMRNEWTVNHNPGPANEPSAPIMLFICGLIAENCDLDEIAQSDPTVRDELVKITNQPLSNHLFETFLDFTKMPIPQVAPSQCIGSLFRAYPVLILRPEAMQWMEQVFSPSNNDSDTKAKLLGVIHEFLISEADKRNNGERARTKDMEALIGNATDLSESGLSTAMVQRNIGHVLDGAKSQHEATQNAALDILSFTVNQGLYHPLQCMPILISLETSDNENVAERALDLHRTLHQKHSSLVNVRFLDFAKSSYEYQRTFTSEVVGHRDGVALLSPWYSLIGEKRAWRHDFLKQLARAFDSDPSGKTVADVGFTLYLCDNLVTLEYKLQEEIMTIVHLLGDVISSSTPLISALERHQLRPDSNLIKGKLLSPPSESEHNPDVHRADVVIHASINVGLAILTKNHLLDLYSIPEDKCLKYVPGKKTTIGDKPATRRREVTHGLDITRMPMARGVETVHEYEVQRAAFLTLIQQDGSLSEMT